MRYPSRLPTPPHRSVPAGSSPLRQPGPPAAAAPSVPDRPSRDGTTGAATMTIGRANGASGDLATSFTLSARSSASPTADQQACPQWPAAQRGITSPCGGRTSAITTSAGAGRPARHHEAYGTGPGLPTTPALRQRHQKSASGPPRAVRTGGADPRRRQTLPCRRTPEQDHPCAISPLVRDDPRDIVRPTGPPPRTAPAPPPLYMSRSPPAASHHHPADSIGGRHLQAAPHRPGQPTADRGRLPGLPFVSALLR